MDDIVVPALLILGVYCFAVMVGFRTRMLTRKTTRTAENMYPLYADPLKNSSSTPRNTAARGKTTEAARRPDAL